MGKTFWCCSKYFLLVTNNNIAAILKELVFVLPEFSHFNNAFKYCRIALARSGNKLWCEKVTTKKVFHNKFYILNRAAIEKSSVGMIASSPMIIQDNDQARVAAIKVFKGSLFSAELRSMSWRINLRISFDPEMAATHSQGNHHYPTQSQSLVSVSWKIKFAKFWYPVF